MNRVRWTCLLLLALTPAARAETLDEAWGIALAVDHRLRAQAELTGAATESLAAAKAAKLPSMANNMGYFALTTQPAYKLDLLITTIPIPIAQSGYFTSLNMVTQPLYTCGRIKNTIAAAAANVNASESEEARTVLDIKMEVAEAFVQVLYARRLVVVAEANVTALEAQVKSVAELVKNEQRAKSDLLAAQVQLADARQQLLQARNGYDLARASYNRYLGRHLTDEVDLEELPPPPDVPQDLNVLTSQALASRPELAELMFQQHGLDRQAAAVRAEGKPAIAATGGFFYFQNKFLAEDQWGILGVTARWDLDCGQTKHRARALDRRASAVGAQRIDLESRIALQVRQAYLDVQTARERVEATRAAVTQSDDNLKQATARYQNNVGTNTEVLDAITLQLRTSANYYNALYNTVLAVLRLRRAVGDL